MTDYVIRSGVLETTNSTGPGTLDLEGASTGWNRFRTRDLADNDYVVYVRRSANGAKHQLIRGQLKFGTGAGGKDQLTVVNVLVSTDGGATPTAIDWVAGDNPCAVFMASAEDLLDSAIRNHFGDTLPPWVKQAIWVAKGAGVTARKLYWRDANGDDIEIATLNETSNVAYTINDRQLTLASAATLNIGAANAGFINVTGTTNITAFDNVTVGVERTLVFAGALKVTHNATSLILPGGNDIFTSAGSVLVMRSDGGGNWRCVGYAPGIAADTRPVGSLDDWPTDVLPPGWLERDGALLSRTTYAALFDVLVTKPGFTGQTFTVTIASPGVVTKTGHGFTGGERLRLSTTGALPTGLDTTSDFFVIYVDANTFRLATSEANAAVGTAINTSGSQSGTHTYTRSLFGLGDGSTTFKLPDDRDMFIRGKAASGRAIASYQASQNLAHTHDVGYSAGILAGGAGGNSISGGTQLASSSSGGSEARPINRAYLPIIKYQ